MWPLIIIAGALLAYSGYQINELIDKLEYKFTGISLIKKETNVYSTALELKLMLINPTEGSIKINNLSGSILVNNSKVADFSYQKPFTIPAASQGGKVNLVIKAVASNKDVLANLLSLILKPQKPQVKMILKVGALATSVTSEIVLMEGQTIKVAA